VLLYFSVSKNIIVIYSFIPESRNIVSIDEHNPVHSTSVCVGANRRLYIFCTSVLNQLSQVRRTVCLSLRFFCSICCRPRSPCHARARPPLSPPSSPLPTWPRRRLRPSPDRPNPLRSARCPSPGRPHAGPPLPSPRRLARSSTPRQPPTPLTRPPPPLSDATATDALYFRQI
jgi:hypothetical protein